MVNARFARATDIVRKTRFLLPDHFVGYVFYEDDGRQVGMCWAGWDTRGRPFLFCELEDEGRKYKYRIARWSKRFVDVLETVCDELYTIEDDEEPGAAKWIEWLGFTETDERINGQRVMKK